MTRSSDPTPHRRAWRGIPLWAIALLIAAVLGGTLVTVRATSSTGKNPPGPSHKAAGSNFPSVTTDATRPPSSTQRPASSSSATAPSLTGSKTGSASPAKTATGTPSATTAGPTAGTPAVSTGSAPASTAPSAAGYFTLAPVGVWSSLPSDSSCAARVRRSSWEPRPDNTRANHTLVDAAAVHRAFAARPVSGGNSTDVRWDNWLLQRVDGQFTGTTDEIFQWAACKWGLSDNSLRAIAVRESTWYQYESYPSGRPVIDWGMGDQMPAGTSGAKTFCDMVATFGRDYQKDFGAAICPRTYGIVGVMSWQDPKWGQMPANQNGTFPFNRRSTAFAVDYLASQLRGCYNGWEFFLRDSGAYQAGDMWGCIGAWYAGDWHSADANAYISRVSKELANRTWLESDWPTIRPSCSATYGCPVPGIQ
jgi:hypothetical protein